MNKNKRLVFISIYCALSLVLDYIKAFIPFLNMPAGGSINISLIPIVVASFHLGVVDGITTGLIEWLVAFVLGLNQSYLSIVQYIFDYIIPSGIVGCASLFYKKKNYFEIEFGVLFMMLIRTISIIFSGAVFWLEGSASAWVASLAYNLPYCIATTIMLLIITPILLHSLKKYML